MKILDVVNTPEVVPLTDTDVYRVTLEDRGTYAAAQWSAEAWKQAHAAGPEAFAKLIIYEIAGAMSGIEHVQKNIPMVMGLVHLDGDTSQKRRIVRVNRATNEVGLAVDRSRDGVAEEPEMVSWERCRYA